MKAKKKIAPRDIFTQEVVAIPIVATILVLLYLVYRQHTDSESLSKKILPNQPAASQSAQTNPESDVVKTRIMTPKTTTILPTATSYQQSTQSISDERKKLPIPYGGVVTMVSPDGFDVIVRVETKDPNSGYANVTVEIPSKNERFGGVLCEQEGCGTSFGLDRAYLNGIDVYNDPNGRPNVEYFPNWKVK